jgi:sugar/nucleoside kinase (ribokinase family)
MPIQYNKNCRRGGYIMKKFDVLAIGELNVDLIVTGLKSMPVLGREIIVDGCSLTLGSSTAICACGIAKLGMKTGFHGKVGCDKFGDVVLESLKKYKIDTDSIIIDNQINTGITISLSMAKDRALVTYLGAIEELSFDDIDLNLIKNTRHIHVGSYFLQNRLREGLSKLFAFAREYGVTTSLDSGWDDTGNWDYGIHEVLKHTDIFLPNEVEALNITKAKNISEAINILSNYAKIVAVKCGPKGVVGKQGDLILEEVTFDFEPVDTTGAGDSFNAGFIYGFLNGFGLEKCMKYGNACGSISVTRVGGASACASLDEVQKLVNA